MTHAILEYESIVAKVAIEKHLGTKIASIEKILAKQRPPDEHIEQFIHRFELLALTRKCDEVWFINAVDKDFVRILESFGYKRKVMSISINGQTYHAHKKVIGH